LENALPAITAFAAYTSPAVAALVWAAFSTIPRVKRLMYRTAKLFIVVIVMLFFYSYVAEYLCSGSALKGFTRCAVIPVIIANLVIPVSLLLMGLLAAWTLVAVVICGRAEFGKIREQKGMQ